MTSNSSDVQFIGDVCMENLFWLILVGIFLYFVYRILKYKGLKGALFGAEILTTVGEVQGKGQGPVGLTLKVHSLKPETASQALVGIELVSKSFASYQMMPITLPASDVQKLISLLEKAVHVSPRHQDIGVRNSEVKDY